ncbi:MAG: lysophospholipid acyltransferase family protein [Pseudomonadota bacterium]
MASLRALIFNILFFGGTTLECLFLWPLLCFGPKTGQLTGRFWCHWVQFLLRNTVNMRPRILGGQHLPDGPCILVSKHQSAWETLTFHTLVRDPAYVLKKELINIPVFGLFLKYSGQVAVDRSAGASALKGMITGVDKALKRGAQIVIFPEGTRTPPGTDRPYHPGIYALYRAFPDVPMIPVALNSGMFWGRHKFMKYGGEVTLEYLEPVKPGLDRKTFMSEIKSRIDGRTRELEKSAQIEFNLPAPRQTEQEQIEDAQKTAN